MNNPNLEMEKFTTTEGQSGDSRSMVDIGTLPNFPCNRSSTPREGNNQTPNKMETPRILDMSMVPDYLQKENFSPEFSSATVSAGSSPVNVTHDECLPSGITGSSGKKGYKHAIKWQQQQQQQVADFMENMHSLSSGMLCLRSDIMKSLELPVPKRRDIKGNHLSKLLFAKSPLTINTYCQFYDCRTKCICNQEMIWKDKNSREKHGSRKYQRHLSKVHNVQLTPQNFTQFFDHNSPLFQECYNYQSSLMSDLFIEPDTKAKEKKRKRADDITRNDSETGQSFANRPEQQQNILELQSKIAMNDLIENLIDLSIPFSVLDYQPMRDWLIKYSIISTDTLPDEVYFKADPGVNESEHNRNESNNNISNNISSTPHNHNQNQTTH
ncbi:RSF1-like protein [Saccharomyces kudriavzevii IFO 1802]|uniref:RSF1-like protein n=2 Tax=Saccharomyces kudriavzevii (strain ATCC MYA-4449 / AS 2.2408 / CBS 8840 / NBRC 1802 / NCYC 2889) TaxID=226230 RepID=J5RTI8_SACK1|nr:RSF1-like protein [Saccharomyces kudriavzevii IFO 1802]